MNMKLVAFLGLLISSTSYGAVESEKRTQIESILEESILNLPLHNLGPLGPEFFQYTIGVSMDYAPELFSVLANVITQIPPKNEKEWSMVNLPPNEHSITCPYNIRAKFRPTKNKRDSPYSFVIMPGAYTALSDESYINRIVDILDRNFQQPNIIRFAGFYHPDFLKDSCTSVPWNTPAVAQDIYFRLNKFLKSISAVPSRSGLIGVSLGASYLFVMMGHDGERGKKENRELLFGLGGFSISPPLHHFATYSHLDKKHQQTTIDPTDSLTSYNFWNFAFKVADLVRNGFLNEAKDIVSYFKEGPELFINRTYNEFMVGLKDILSAVGIEGNDEEMVGNYIETFVLEGFIRDHGLRQMYNMNNLTPVIPVHNKVVDLRPSLASLERPLFLFVAQDEILYSDGQEGLPEEVVDVLNVAFANDNIIVFNPKYGGHSGLFVDPIFENLLVEFFK